MEALYDSFDSQTIPGCEMQVYVDAPIPLTNGKVPVAIGTLQSAKFESRTQIKKVKSIGRPSAQVQPGFTQVRGVLTFAEGNDNACLELLQTIHYVVFDENSNTYLFTDEAGSFYKGKNASELTISDINNIFKGINLSFKYVGYDETGAARTYTREIFGIMLDEKASASGLDILSQETQIAFTASKYRNFHK